jgi:hypothetical protein
MANKADTSTSFRISASVAAVLLIVAAALTFLQGSGGGAQSTEMAALSQAIPGQASAAVAGTPGGFDKLDASLKRLASLRRSAGASIPGSSSQWQQLESRAGAIVAKRADIEALAAATANIQSGTTSILELSNEMLDRAGATSVMQEFQQRAARIGQSVAGLAGNPDVATVAANVSADATFLQTVSDALSGEDTELDVRPLNNAGQEAVIVPLAGLLAELQTEVERVNSSAGQIGNIAETRAQLATSAENLAGAFSSDGGGSPLPVFLQTIWIPLGLIALAIILLIVMIVLNSKSSQFESTAKIQAEQGRRRSHR